MALATSFGDYATAATAIGTLALAIATFFMARKTKDLASLGQAELELLDKQTQAAQRQSVVAEAALSASVAPLIVDVPPYTMRPGPPRTTINPEGLGNVERTERDVSLIRYADGRDACVMTVPIQNVGSGAARIQRAALVPLGVQTSTDPVLSESPSVVPRDEIRELIFRPDNRQALKHLVEGLPVDLALQVSYCDVSGRQPASTVLTLRRSPSHSARPDRFFVRDVSNSQGLRTAHVSRGPGRA
jgi:hypothetical protein